MKKFLVKISLFILGIALAFTPFGIFMLVGHSQPHIYSKTYYAALVDKVHYLESIKNEKKIILVGGSNVAFGFNSKLIEGEFPEYKVVNFGLYAMLGTKIMMDLALEYVGPEDMVFLSPEINTQSTSLYFDPLSTLKATEDDESIIFKLPKDNRESTIGKYFSFVKERGEYNSPIEPSGVYQRKNFNKYGDINYSETDFEGILYRSRNRMILHYDPTMMVDYSYSIDQSFFDYVNEFNEAINKKQAKLYYTFSPVNDLSVIDQEKASNYYWNIREKLACQTIGNPNEYIIDPHYFYDSNFHLNDSGAIYRTYYFVKDIYRDIYLKSQLPKFDIPEKPSYVEIDPGDVDDDPNVVYFNLKEEESGYVVTGLKDNALDYEELRLPEVYDHKYVIGISPYAFEGSHLKRITIPNSYRFFENKAFDNCLSLTRVYLETITPSNLVVDYLGGLLNNISNEFKFMVPIQSLNSYKVDYNWQFYREYLLGYEYDPN